MAKRGSNQKSGNRNPKKMKSTANVDLQDMDDEVDLFHKQRDKIPLDMYDDSAESDDDNEHPVFNYKGADEDDSEDEDDSADDEDDEKYDKSFNKIVKTQKYLKAKHGNLEDEDLDDAEEDTEEKRTVWGRSKSIYHDADNIDFELQSSDEESDLEEEEAEAIRLRKETLKSMTMEDFGLEDDEKAESDVEPTLGEIMVNQKDASVSTKSKGIEASVSSKSKGIEDNLGVTCEEVKKDLKSLSREEQMAVVYSSAPELVGLLADFGDSLTQLDKINPLVRRVEILKAAAKTEELHYLEVKKILLLMYCQYITFYLLLKSEGKPVRDHPVMARLVETKSLLDKTKKLDEYLPALEVLLADNEVDVAMVSAEKTTTASNDLSSDPNYCKQPATVKQKAPKSRTVDALKMEVQKVKGLDNKHKRHQESVSSQSAKMLRARAAFEERLRQEGVFTKLESNKQKVTTLESNKQKTKKHILQRHNSRFETLDDFRDDDVDVDASAPTMSKKISQILNMNKGNKKMVSGDEDLPQRDSLEERRRKHEIRVLSRARVGSVEDDGENAAEESKDKLNNIQERKLASKDSKALAIPSEPETVDGRRLITQQMEKNRGLTPYRKKLAKNPRKKYKLKHEKAQKRLGGQVRQMRFPQGPYGGEANGINDSVTHSIRFKW